MRPATCCSPPARRRTAATSCRRGRCGSSCPAPIPREADIVVGPGTLLGELALVTETKRPVTATAIEPTTVMRVSRSLFRKVLEGFPDAARLMRDRIASRASEATSELQVVRDMLLPKPPRQ